MPLRSMEVVRLDNGRFCIRIIASNKLPRTVGNFETEEEADAWLLQQGESDDEAVMGDGLLKPGPSLDTL